MAIRQKLILSSTLMCLGLSGLAGCGDTTQTPTSTVEEVTKGTDSEEQGDRLNITVSILPQQYFVEKIGGDRVNVQVMVPEGAEPEVYEPKPQQLKDLSETDAYIAVGILFEDVWAERFKTANSEMLLTDGSEGIEKIEMVAHNHAHHGHGAEEHSDHEDEHADHDDHDDHDKHDDEKHAEHSEHDHDEEHADHDDHSDHEEHSEEDHEDHDDHGEDLEDPHTWLSPSLAKVHAQNIYDVLVELDPASEALFKENLDALLAEIDELDQAIAAELENLSSRSFLVFHPAWGYFAEEYNLEQIPIEVEGQDPSAAELAELIQVAEAENIRVVFAQYQFNSKSAETIANQIGGEVVFIDPLSVDWANNLQEIAKQIALANN
ncbi:metal ABC transporter solute-binding protein, Zn/Mn family [[Leptolyngbya] sp. PCC 7376]|uniref:metal ABC transporter solute-binding protein, Zn/Mn family n=1 Tax=[Leptolyngbya] sp. PCC 7376 TaxID=111781 RepID=UPI0002D8B9A4|nr:zinc ABC transporter substrate-binding protein [[Leptolyngbya] sp. PCC 7376]